MKKRRLTSEEERLWRRVTMGVASMHSKPASPATGLQSSADQALQPASETKTVVTAPRQIVSAPPTDLFRSGDPRSIRNIKRGRKAIDATLDLHGHTQASAYRAVHDFIALAVTQGFGRLLIITGKGSRNRSAHQAEGVLQRALPQWLALPPLNQHVARIDHAHQRHGGMGAYYIVMKSTNNSAINHNRRNP